MIISFFPFFTEYGGIYLDTDQVILKSLDTFRNADTTIGLDYSTQASNSLIIATPKAPFIKLWYDTYHTFSKSDGNKHSQVIPYKLSKRHPELVKVVGSLFSSHNANQLSNIYVKNLDWSHQYGMHLHLKLQNRFYENKLSFDSVKTMNNTAGAVARWILYQNTDVCKERLRWWFCDNLACVAIKLNFAFVKWFLIFVLHNNISLIKYVYYMYIIIKGICKFYRKYSNYWIKTILYW